MHLRDFVDEGAGVWILGKLLIFQRIGERKKRARSRPLFILIRI